MRNTYYLCDLLNIVHFVPWNHFLSDLHFALSRTISVRVAKVSQTKTKNEKAETNLKFR